MHLAESMTLPLAADAAARMYADPSYAQVRRGALEADAASAQVEGSAEAAFTATTTLRMPTDQVPDMVRRFVGQSVEVRETQAWQAPAPDGSREGTIRFDVVGAPASMTGSARMVPVDASSCRVEITGDLVAKVPLLGRKLEQAALPYVSEVLRREERSAATWAAQQG